MWTIDDTISESHGRWQQWPMAPTPDGLTDVTDWDVGWWVAGHRNLRPVVYDFNEKGGASMPVPNTPLDPGHPVVYIAAVPISAPMVLATQSVDGPTVWVQKGRDWQRIPAPSGKLAAAQTARDGVYVLIDGALWFREVPGLTC